MLRVLHQMLLWGYQKEISTLSLGAGEGIAEVSVNEKQMADGMSGASM